MLGHPKYKLGDIVDFRWRQDKESPSQTLTGIVAIVDSFGTFFDDSDVCYDILVKSTDVPTLYKHMREGGILLKTGEVPEDQIWD